MTRHTFQAESILDGKTRPVEVVTGWDRPLQHYFLNVEYLDYKGEDDDTEDGEYGPDKRHAYLSLSDPALMHGHLPFGVQYPTTSIFCVWKVRPPENHLSVCTGLDR